MELHNRKTTELLPYEKLAVLGIDREKADNLPLAVSYTHLTLPTKA